MLREYLAKRKAAGLSNATLNMVVGVIRRVLKMGKRWYLFADELKRLPERSHVRRALDVDFFERTITIRRSKTHAGERRIPMNDDALSAMLDLLKQAQEAHADKSEHFIFPACESSRIDPSRPQKSWRTEWRTLTRGIRCPACRQIQSPGETCRRESCKADISKIKSPLVGLRFHDLRHTAITVLAESDASEQTVMPIAGHVSRKMLEHYSHIRMEAKRRAVGALMTPKSVPVAEQTEAYVTKYVTNRASRDVANPQLTEKNGGPGLT